MTWGRFRKRGDHEARSWDGADDRCARDRWRDEGKDGVTTAAERRTHRYLAIATGAGGVRIFGECGAGSGGHAVEIEGGADRINRIEGSMEEGSKGSREYAEATWMHGLPSDALRYLLPRTVCVLRARLT